MCVVCDTGTADVCQVRSCMGFVFWLSIVIKREGIISYSKDQKMEEAEEDAESDLGKEGEEEAEEESAESDLGKEEHFSFLFSCFINIELFLLFIELDMEGIITPDKNVSQEMGDPLLEVTEDMRDKAQEERVQGSICISDGIFLSA